MDNTFGPGLRMYRTAIQSSVAGETPGAAVASTTRLLRSPPRPPRVEHPQGGARKQRPAGCKVDRKEPGVPLLMWGLTVRSLCRRGSCRAISLAGYATRWPSDECPPGW